MTVTFVHDPEAAEATDVAAVVLNRPEVGIVAFRVPPETRRVAALHHAYLDALGKRDDERHGWDRAKSLSWIDASAWTQAHQIRRIVVIDSNHASVHAVVDLCQWATGNTVDLTLIASGPVSLHFREAISMWVDLPMGPPHLKDLDAKFPAPTTDTADPATTLPVMPTSDFLTFRADARRQLPEHFDVIDAIYTSTLSDLSEQTFTDEERTAEAIHDHLCQYSDPALRTVALRAIQAAAFKRGVHIDIDVPGVLRSVAPVASLRWLTSDQWHQITSASRPSTSAIVALLAAGIPAARIPTLPRSHVTDDASTISDAGTAFTVPEPGQTAIRAQLHAHGLAGHVPEAPFIYDTARTRARDIRERLNRFAATIGVNVRLAHDSLTNNRWQYRYGVKLEPLGMEAA